MALGPRTAKDTPPGIADLFRGEVRRTAVLTILVCSVSLTAHWAFLFWFQHHLRNLPDVINLPPTRKNELAAPGQLRGDGGRPRRELRRGGAGPGHWVTGGQSRCSVWPTFWP